MRKVFVGIYVLSALITLGTYFTLPDDIAVHFDGDGRPNGWSSRETHLVIMLIVLAVVFATFHSLPNLLRVLPPSLINIPHRDYWLAEERREETVQRMASLLAEIGIATMAFMTLVVLLVVDANFKDPVRMSGLGMWGGLGFYLAFTMFWCIRLLLAFRKPDEFEQPA